METHNFIQGSPEWHAYRAAHFNASDASAMMGASPYKKRTELLHEIAGFAVKDVNAATQALFDNGHRFEALARPLAEEIIGEELYPVTGSTGKLSASFDGLTIAEDIAFEHKTLNDEIRAAATVADLHLHYRIQMEQQLHISGAKKCLFMATRWDNDQLVEKKHFWYKPDQTLRASILAGWEQFAKDLVAYEPVEIFEKPKAEAIMQLPALAIQIRGEVMLSNLPDFKIAAERFIENIKTDLTSDQDFSDAEATVKFCEKAEKDLELAKSAAIAQTASIDELMRTVDHIRDQLRTKRLTLTNLIKTKKDAIKESLLAKVKLEFIQHVSSLESEIRPLRLIFPVPDFAGAMKNKRTLASLIDAVNTKLAEEKITVNAAATSMRSKLAWFKQNAAGYEFLFSDLQNITSKQDDDFSLFVTTRIADHKRAEEQKLAVERERIQREEQAKAERDAAAKIAAEKAAEAAAVAKLRAAETPPAAPKEKPVEVVAQKKVWRPGDAEIIEVLSIHFNVDEPQIVEWLSTMDLEKALTACA